MAGPYVDITGLSGSQVLAHYSGYARVNDEPVTDADRQIDAELLNKLVGGQVNVVEKATALQALIDALQVDLTAVQGIQSGLQSDMTAAQSDIDALQALTSSMQSTLTTAVANVSTLQSDMTAVQDWIDTYEPQINASSGYRINVVNYGAILDGATNNRTAVSDAITAADSLKLPIYIPHGAGSCVVQYSTNHANGNDSESLTLFDGAEVFGDGPKSVIEFRRASDTHVIFGFTIPQGCSVRIRDLRVTSNMVALGSVNDPNAAAFHLRTASGNPTNEYRNLFERVWIDSFHFGVYSESGSVNSINYLTTDLILCDIQAHCIGVAYYSDSNAPGVKRLHVTGGYYHAQDETNGSSSHLIYVHPCASLRTIGVRFDHWKAQKYAIHHYGESSLLGAQYAQITACTFGPNGLGYGIITQEFIPEVITGNVFNCRAAIEIFKHAVIIGNSFIPDGTLVGSAPALVTSYGTNTGRTILIEGNRFDVSGMVGSGAVCIKPAAETDDTWLLAHNFVRCAADLGQTWNYVSTSSPGAASTTLVRSTGDTIVAYDSSGNVTPLQAFVCQNGTFEIRGLRVTGGDSTVDRGVIRCDSATYLNSVDLEDCYIDVTRGFPVYTDSTSAGKVSGRNNRFGTSTSFSRIDCTSGTLGFRFRDDYYTSNRTGVSTALTAWAANRAYRVGQLVQNDSGKKYRCITAGTSASSGGPIGTSTDIADNTAHWKYLETASTHRVATIYNDFREYDASGTIDSVLVLGRENDTYAFEGAKIELYSSDGTLSLTGLGNIVATAGARAIGTRVTLRRYQGLWYEV